MQEQKLNDWELIPLCQTNPNHSGCLHHYITDVRTTPWEIKGSHKVMYVFKVCPDCGQTCHKKVTAKLF